MTGSVTSGSGNVFLVALRRWPIALLVAVGVSLGAFAAAQSPPSTYRATAVVSFLPKAEYQADLVRLSLPRYQAFAASTDQIDAVSDELDLPRKEVREAVEVTIPAESPNIEIAVTTTSAKRSAAIANELAELTVSFAEKDGVTRAASLQKALPPSAPSGPDRLMVTAAGILAGVALGLAVAFLLEWRRPRIRSTRDLEVLAGDLRVEVVPRNSVIATPAPLGDPSVALAAIRLGHSMTELGVGDTDESAATIAVVASRARSGTSSVATLIAAAMERDGRSVVLLDLSTRPRSSRLLPARPEPEVDEEAHAGASTVAAASETAPVRTGPSGSATRRPTDQPSKDRDPEPPGRNEDGTVELVRWHTLAKGTEITSASLAEQLRLLAKRADVIIVDCPPVESGELPVIVAGVVSMLAVVVPRGSMAREALRTLELARHACRGPVIVIGNAFAAWRSDHRSLLS